MVQRLGAKNWKLLHRIAYLVAILGVVHLIFRDELALLQKRFQKLHLCQTLTRSDPASEWKGEMGRANAALLKKFAPHYANIPVYLCGPDEMMESTRQLLLSVGVPEGSIHTEAFVSPAGSKETESELEKTEAESRNDTSAGAITKDRRIEFRKSKSDCVVDARVSVLEAAEQSGIELPFECGSGICGQCKLRLISGTVTMETQDGLSPSESKQGLILACQSHVTSDVVVDA